MHRQGRSEERSNGRVRAMLLLVPSSVLTIRIGSASLATHDKGKVGNGHCQGSREHAESSADRQPAPFHNEDIAPAAVAVLL